MKFEKAKEILFKEACSIAAELFTLEMLKLKTELCPDDVDSKMSKFAMNCFDTSSIKTKYHEEFLEIMNSIIKLDS